MTYLYAGTFAMWRWAGSLSSALRDTGGTLAVPEPLWWPSFSPALFSLLQFYTWSRRCFIQYRSGHSVQLEIEGFPNMLKETAALGTTSGFKVAQPSLILPPQQGLHLAPQLFWVGILLGPFPTTCPGSKTTTLILLQQESELRPLLLVKWT